MRILWRALVADHETCLWNNSNNNTCLHLSHVTCPIDLYHVLLLVSAKIGCYEEIIPVISYMLITNSSAE